MEWIIIVVYLFAFGILSSIGAKKKNRDVLGWFIIGFIFGIFGFIASLIVEKKKENQRFVRPAVSFDPSQLSKKCPDCAELIKLEARVCRFCQRRFSEEEIKQEIVKLEGSQDSLGNISENQSSTIKKVSCPVCTQLKVLKDYEISSRKYTCPHCGTIVMI